MSFIRGPSIEGIRAHRLVLHLEVKVAPYAFMDCMVQSWMLHDHILQDGEIYGMDLDFDRALDVLVLCFQILILAVLLEMIGFVIKSNHEWNF